jgi:hypothetical protein
MRRFCYLLAATILPGYLAAGPAWAQHCSAPKNGIFFSTGTTPVSLVERFKEVRVLSIVCTNTDPSNSYNVQFSIVRESNTYPLVTITIPANAGNAVGKASKAVLTAENIPGLPIDAQHNPYLVMDSSDTLQMATDTIVANGKRIFCIAIVCEPSA